MALERWTDYVWNCKDSSGVRQQEIGKLGAVLPLASANTVY